MRKLDLFLKLMRVTGGMAVVRGISALRARRLIVLAYHRVLNPGPEALYPFDIELVSAAPEQFDWQVRLLKSHYDPVTFRDVIASMDGGPALPARPVIITFDDGFSDNYEHAFPVLKRHGVPATFFVSTDYMDQARTFWFDRVAALMLRMPVQALSFPELDRALPWGDAIDARRNSTCILLNQLKSMPDARRLEVLELAEQVGASSLDEQQQHLSKPLRWEQILEMQDSGMEFGSHTQSHPILSRISPEQLERELAHSKRDLAARLHRPVEVLSYPVGMGDAIDESVRNAASRAGFRIACSYESGANVLPRSNQFDIRRQHVERYTTQDHFRMLLELPSLVR